MKFRDDVGTGEDSLAYLSLKDKETVKGVFRGDIAEFREHWTGSHSERCPGAGCSRCAAGDKPRFRFMVNFVLNENGQYVAKVFKQGWLVYGLLRDLNKDYPLENHIVKITRSGSGKNDTTYTVLPVPGGAITPDVEAKLAKVKLVDLAEKPQQDVVQTHAAVAGAIAQAPFMTEEDLPF